MGRQAIIVRIKFEEVDGAFVVTSPDMPELCLVSEDLSPVLDDIPNIIEAIFEARGQTVSVYSSRDDAAPLSAPWVAIPKSATPDHAA